MPARSKNDSSAGTLKTKKFTKPQTDKKMKKEKPKIRTTLVKAESYCTPFFISDSSAMFDLQKWLKTAFDSDVAGEVVGKSVEIDQFLLASIYIHKRTEVPSACKKSGMLYVTKNEFDEWYSTLGAEMKQSIELLLSAPQGTIETYLCMDEGDHSGTPSCSQMTNVVGDTCQGCYNDLMNKVRKSEFLFPIPFSTVWYTYFACIDPEHLECVVGPTPTSPRIAFFINK